VAPTLSQLLAHPGLGLRVVAGAPDGPVALRRRVTWVAVSELTDPTPYLEGGELVLLTGVGTDLDGGAAGYVERLLSARVSAVGFGVGVVLPAVPPALCAAADAARLPLLEVDQPTPFIAVGKALADLIALDQGERMRRRLDGMRSLTALLAGGADPEAALLRLAGLAGRSARESGGGWAALLDGRGRAVAEAGPRRRPELAGELAAQLRTSPGHASAAASDELGWMTVLPLALRDRARGSAASGYLAVCAGPGTDPDHQLVAFAASLFALDREHARGARLLVRWARSAALAARTGLAAPEPPPAVLGPLAGPGAVRAIAVRRPLEAVLDALPDEGGVGGLALGDGWSVLVVAEPEVEDVVAAIPDAGRGVSASVPDPGHAAGLTAAIAQARSLATRARGRALRAGEDPPSLLELLGPEAAVSFAEGVLGPLRAAPDGEILLQSLRGYLAAHGALAMAADRLGVHRHTLRARLRRASRLLGADLDDVGTRTTLWVALSATTPPL
jgi:purine catabolism regulator